MKKILVATSALVAAGFIAAGPAAASDKIKLNLGGYSKWWVVGAWQDDKYQRAIDNGTAGQGSANSVDVKGDNEVWFEGSTKLDNGLEVGFHAELEAGGNTDTNTSYRAVANSDVIDKSYVYVTGGFGKVILGTESNGTVLMHVMSPDAAGNMGSDGLLTGGLAISVPATMATRVTTEIDTDAEADKITYVSPSFYGFAVGGSYVPNVNEDNQNVFGTGGSTFSSASEIYGIAAMYAGEVGPVGVKASTGWVTYDVEAGTSRSNEYSAGTQLSYAGFTLGGSFRAIRPNLAGGSDGSNTTSVSGRGNTWDVGLSYETGPYTVSLVYFTSQAEGDLNNSNKDTSSIYQVSGKYALGEGVDLLGTVGHVQYDDETAKTGSNADANHNKGWAVMTGLSLTF